MSLSAYEVARLENIERNRLHLESLGLGKVKQSMRQILIKPRVKPKKPSKKKRPRATTTTTMTTNNIFISVPRSGRRKSRRLSGESAPLSSGLSQDWQENDDEDDEEDQKEDRWPARPEVDIFGALPGIPVGFKFDSRADACTAGIHRATVAGIVGRSDVGCYSIVLNGGYADDLDEGTHLTYTGSGGRSLKGTKGKKKRKGEKWSCFYFTVYSFL